MDPGLTARVLQFSYPDPKLYQMTLDLPHDDTLATEITKMFDLSEYLAQKQPWIHALYKSTATPKYEQ